MLSISAAIYGLAVRFRNSLFDRGILKPVHIKRPVISIGNITAGGAGKTPLTILLSNLLLDELNISNVIIGRGYKKKKKGIVVVSDGKQIFEEPVDAGDEMYLMAINTKAAVIACEKKYLAATYADNNFNFDCLLVDDGFQHRKLKRDLDIVIVDAKTINNKGLLPKGRLREPIENLKRADVIAIRDMEEPEVTSHLNSPNHCLFIYIKSIYTGLSDKDNHLINFNDINEIYCFSGLADNGQFTQMLKSCGLTISGVKSFNDHYDYELNDITGIIGECLRNGLKACITTEKDYVKLSKFLHLFEENSINLYYPKLSFEITRGKDELKERISKLF